MDKQLLLIDSAPFTYTTRLVEGTDGERFLEVEGRFQHADLPNGNGRVYPRSLWEKVLSDKRIQESLQEGSMLGELDHPADGKTSLQRVSHLITGLQMREDGEVVGKARILNNKWGEQLKSIFEAGGKVGISSRGSGSVRSQGGNQVVQEDFTLNTFDFVTVPSTPNAFPTPVGESKKSDKKMKTEEKKENSMDALKALTEIKEEATILLSATPKGNAVAKLAEKLDSLEYRVSKLINEDKAVQSLATPVINSIRTKRAQILNENPESNYTMDGTFMAAPPVMGGVFGSAADPKCGPGCKQVNGKCVCPPDLKGKCSPGCELINGECVCPEDKKGNDNGAISGAFAQYMQGVMPTDQQAANFVPCACGMPGCSCAQGQCKCAENRMLGNGMNKNESLDESFDLDIDAIIAELEEEDTETPAEVPATSTRNDSRIAEAGTVASGMVIKALVNRVREIMANQSAPVAADASLKEENERLRTENERMRGILERLNADITEAADREQAIAPLVEDLIKKDPDAFDWKGYLLEAKDAKDLQARHDKMKAQNKVADPSMPPTGYRSTPSAPTATISEGVDLARRIVSKMKNTRTTHIERGGQILEAKSNVR